MAIMAPAPVPSSPLRKRGPRDAREAPALSASLNGRSTLSNPPAPCWLEVDLDAVGENVRALRQLVGPRTRLAAVVKAEAYGLGAVAVARAALAAGADYLAVARI